MRTAARVCGGPFCTVDFSLRTRYHIYISPAREHEVRSSAQTYTNGKISPSHDGDARLIQMAGRASHRLYKQQEESVA